MANPLLFFPLPSPLTRSRGKETVHLGSSTVLQRRDETLMIVSLMRANVNKGREREFSSNISIRGQGHQRASIIDT